MVLKVRHTFRLYVPVYASASYNHTINDFKDGVSDDNGDRYALEAGAMLLPNFLVAVGYTSVADQISLDAFGVNNTESLKLLVNQLLLMKNKMP